MVIKNILRKYKIAQTLYIYVLNKQQSISQGFKACLVIKTTWTYQTRSYLCSEIHF